MTPFIKKINLALGLLLSVSTSYSYADVNTTTYMANSCCNPCQSSCGEGFIGAELLYWRPFLDGLDTCVPTAVSDTVLPDGRIISTFHGRGKDPRFEWNPGFRIGAGYKFACSNWDLGARWTHFDSKSHRSLSDDDENGFDRFRWNIHLDVVDLVVAYQSHFNSCFSLRPYLGIRVARIDQKLRLGGFPTFTTFAITGENLATDNKHKFTGVGPLFGLEADLQVACGFSIYVNGDVSWLYGRNDVRLTNSTTTNDVIDFCSIKSKINSTLVSVDASFGVRWHTCFFTDKQVFVQLGFEHNQYFDYSRIGKCGDLSFDGLNLGVGVGF